jgi:hypothetical protein
MGRHAESCPGLAVTEISNQVGIEIAHASPRVTERILADGMMKAVFDPLKVVCRVIADEDAAPMRHRVQLLLEVSEDFQWIKGRARHRKARRATSAVQGQSIVGPTRTGRVADGSNHVWSSSSTVATT